MPTVPQTLLFLLKWTLVGLAIAAVLLLVRPAQTGPSAAPATQEAPVAPVSFTPGEGELRRSFADAVSRAGPAVVNIYTARVVANASQSP